MRIIPSAPAPRARDGRLRVAILGCTGSIGTQTLDVCRKHADKLEVVALSAGTSWRKVAEAAREFGVRRVALADASIRDAVVADEFPDGCEISFGQEEAASLASLDEVDAAVIAVVGAAGIDATHAALASGKLVACANKEALVVAGDLLMPMTKPGLFVPVDSEHSAIFQCLVGEADASLSRIWLTCSGGPFYGLTTAELASKTAADALAHPTWNMGYKITIDSATLMNKGLEVIEAHHLFEVGVDDVTVLVQRQSRVHSMVELADGMVKAQLGPSDMRAPIQYALSFPERWESSFSAIDFCHEEPLVFGEADPEAFRCLALAYEAGRAGGTLPCVLNAANEVANEAFRANQIGFLQVADVVEQAMDCHDVARVESLGQLREIDAWARDVAWAHVRRISA